MLQQHLPIGRQINPLVKNIGIGLHLLYLDKISVQTVVPWLVLMNKITVSENTKTRLMYNELKSLRAFDHVPAEYQNQVIQYFLVNDHLQTVYFSMYDDRINVKALQHCVLVVTRESVKTEISEQKTRLDDALTVLEDIKRSLI